MGLLNRIVWGERCSRQEGAEHVFREGHGIMAFGSLWKAHHPEIVPATPIFAVLHWGLEGLHPHLKSVKGGSAIPNGVTHVPLGLPQLIAESLRISPKSVCSKSILVVRVVLQPEMACIRA